jgi:thiol-disulfide isomerase/thioredoxin
MKKLNIFIIVFVFLAIISCNSSDKGSVEKSRNEAPVVKNINTQLYNQIKAENKDKVLLITFFASWCPACKQETPGFIKVYNEFKDKKFQLIGISVDKNIQDAENFVKQFGVTYPVYLSDAALAKKLNIYYLPTNIIYKPGGGLFDVKSGAMSEDRLIGIIKELTK